MRSRRGSPPSPIARAPPVASGHTLPRLRDASVCTPMFRLTPAVAGARGQLGSSTLTTLVVLTVAMGGCGSSGAAATGSGGRDPGGGPSATTGTAAAAGMAAVAGSATGAGGASAGGHEPSVPLPDGTELVVAGIVNPEALVVSGGTLYFTDCAGDVVSVPVGGGVPTVLASGQACPGPIAVDDVSVYWATDAGSVMKAPLAGGQPVALAEGLACPCDVAVDGADVYFTTRSALMKVSIDGGDASEVASLGTDVAGAHVAVDSSAVYFTDFSSPPSSDPSPGPSKGSLVKVPLDGGPPSQLATGFAYGLGKVTLAGDRAYFAAYQGSSPGIFEVPLTGGTPVELVSEGAGPIAVDASAVYWVNGDLKSVLLDSGSTVTIVSSAGGDGTIAVDSSKVYFGRQGTLSSGGTLSIGNDGSILAVQK